MQRHTKIIATLGPSVADEGSVRSLVEAGMDVARLNFSHGDHELHALFARWVRTAARDLGRSIAVLQDIQGPKLRVGEFEQGSVILEEGAEVRLSPSGGAGGRADWIPVGFEALVEDVAPGAHVLLADGLIRLVVTGVAGEELIADVVVGCELDDHKGVAFPDSHLSLENVTPKDEADLAFGRKIGVDYVAASFVRSGADVKADRRPDR